MVDKSEITGAVGTPAPPGAPHEVTDGVPTDVIYVGKDGTAVSAVQMARANEVELPPFNPDGGKQMTIEQQAVFLGKTVDEILSMRRAAGVPVTDASRWTAAPPTTPLTKAVPRGAPIVVPTATTPTNPAPSPPAPLPAGVILDVRGKPVTSSVRPVPPRPARSSLRPVHKPPTVVAGEPLEQQEPPEGLPADVEMVDTEVDTEVERAIGALDTVSSVSYSGQPRDSLPAPEPEPSPLPIAPPDPAKHQPAASNTDSPARGTPPPMSTLPEGKRITGGFGDPAEAQYYPLDGTELRELVYALMDAIHARLQDDLRFSFAITYPRVAARVVVEIEAFGQDGTLSVEKVLVPPHEKTPIEVARLYGDQVVFCVTAERAEMTEDGRSIAPPNQTREELQLPIPRKTAVQTPTGRQIVDVRR